MERGRRRGGRLGEEGFDIAKSPRLIQHGDESEESPSIERIELAGRSVRLGISALGAYETASQNFIVYASSIEGWYLSYFTPDAARSLPLAGPQRRLNALGDNLGNVVQFMEREHPDRFERILERIAERVPGIDRISTERSA